jgi:hypothetical protein
MTVVPFPERPAEDAEDADVAAFRRAVSLYDCGEHGEAESWFVAASVSRFPHMLDQGFLEPIHKVVESEESVVIPSLAPASLLRGAECGSPNIAVLPTATAYATRVI